MTIRRHARPSAARNSAGTGPTEAWARRGARHTTRTDFPAGLTVAIRDDIAVVTTQPASKSQQNVQRRGFDLLYTRAVLVQHP